MIDADRQLMLDAAKAVGHPTDTAIWNDGLEPYSSGQGYWQVTPVGLWNPLVDMSQALALAVDLHMTVGTNGNRTMATATRDHCHAAAMEPHGQNARLATCRAIVRCAAALLKEQRWGDPK